MTRKEFKQWADDLLARLPELGRYVLGLGEVTRDLWFDEIFSRFELRDSLAMNQELFTEGEGIGKFERDKLPSLFIRKLQDFQFAREKREQAKRHATTGALKAVTEHKIMGPAFAQVVEQIREWKKEHNGEHPSGEQIDAWAVEASKTFDNIPQDEEREPRYSCLTCKDQHVVTYAKANFTYCGACPNCDGGRKRFSRSFRSSRMLGYAETEGGGIDNQFNDRLKEV